MQSGRGPVKLGSLFDGIGGFPYSAAARGDSSPCVDRGQNFISCTGVNPIIRRLTPVECERMQGFPDGWTAFGHDGKAISDTAGYKALGNSVAVPCVDYIMNGISKTEDF